MCLAIPGKIIEREGDMALLEIEGIRRKVNVTFLPEAAVGDYVIVHAGFAIQKWEQEDVDEFNKIMDEMRELDK
ncbi:MAG: HypC/HybG/HupF family hydrogenase formation chaperone [Chitinivibrionales bacterium]|nr:HypC/HybG/HupF family hydrogenase formation chaperone [Chitinivibrionales bacterium]